MKNIIKGMYAEIKFLEEDLNSISQKIRNEKNEDLKAQMIKTKEEIYKRIIEIEDDIDELESYENF